MEVNETITFVGHIFYRDQFGDEGRQAQWPWGKFFQSGWVEKGIRLCQARAEKHKARTCAEARVSVVLVSSHPENPEKHQNLPTFFSDNDYI